MKNYVKPAMEVTELRVNEGLAASSPLGTFNTWLNGDTTVRAGVTTFNLADILGVTSEVAV